MGVVSDETHLKKPPTYNNIEYSKITSLMLFWKNLSSKPKNFLENFEGCPLTHQKWVLFSTKIKNTLILNIKISWKIYGQYHPPSKLRYTPRGKGGYTGGGIGGTPIVGGVFIYFYMVPPYETSSINMSIYVSFIIQIYELYFTMSNF